MVASQGWTTIVCPRRRAIWPEIFGIPSCASCGAAPDRDDRVAGALHRHWQAARLAEFAKNATEEQLTERARQIKWSGRSDKGRSKVEVAGRVDAMTSILKLMHEAGRFDGDTRLF